VPVLYNVNNVVESKCGVQGMRKVLMWKISTVI